MSAVGWCIRILAKGLDVIGLVFARAADLLWDLLPAVLPPDRLARQVRSHYDRLYTPHQAPTKEELQEDRLEAWEMHVLTRYRINSGRLLAMGTGWGREALAIARRGVTVVGVETNPVALRVAQTYAAQAGISAHFHRADFTALPYADGSFDFAFLATTMYSAIPGMAKRQAWLTGLRRLLKPGGLVVLSFERKSHPPGRATAISRRLNTFLHRLPGANRDYRPGDSYAVEHYMHVFQSEGELRAELEGAGSSIHELRWTQGYAVVSFPKSRGKP